MKLSLVLALALLEAVSARQLHAGPLEQELPATPGKEDPGELDPPFPMESKGFQMTVDRRSYHYRIVKGSQKFWKANKICASSCNGRLASIHSPSDNKKLVRFVRSRTNQGLMWIGGTTSHLFWHTRCCWVDGSHWNYSNWAHGNPQRWFYWSMCVALSISDGRWININCKAHLPFICKF